MKKILCIMLALLMLSGCSGSGEKDNAEYFIKDRL